MPKFFVTDHSFDENGEVYIEGGDAAHIRQVLRGREGDLLTVCDGAGVDYACEIIGVEREAVRLRICTARQAATEPPVRVTLFQALPKGDKMEMVIQKAVELGVHRIVPVLTEHTVVKLTQKDKKTERYNKVAEAAAKQCMRGMIPQVTDAAALAEACTLLPALDEVYVAYENTDGALVKEGFAQSKGAQVGIFIGPEGGFSPKEIAYLESRGARAVSLGRRILRTETAGMVALTLLLYERGAL